MEKALANRGSALPPLPDAGYTPNPTVMIDQIRDRPFDLKSERGVGGIQLKINHSPHPPF